MTELNIGVIGLPGKWSTEALADAVEQKTGRRMVVDLATVHADLGSGQLCYQGQDLCQLDAIIIKKVNGQYSAKILDQLQLLRIAEASGVRIFSPVNSIMQLINRLSCTVTLNNAGIPMPHTRVTGDVETAIKTVRDFGAAVFKPLYSTKARGMLLLDDSLSERKLKQMVEGFHEHNPLMYIQQHITLPNYDLGLMFLAGRYIGTYARVMGKDSWNTTIHDGGYYQSHQPSDDIIEIAWQAQNLFNLDFTSVDMAETEHGPMVFEVSAFGGFKGAKKGAGLNAAEMYVDYVINSLS